MVSRNTIRDFILEHLPKHPQDITRITSKKFKISVQAVQKHMTQLIREGLVTKTGKTRASTYSRSSVASGITTNPSQTLPSKPDEKETVSFDLKAKGFQEDEIWVKKIAPFVHASKNVNKICEYAFSEMLNNAKDHSQCEKIHVSLNETAHELNFTIYDDGIGIFEKIKSSFNFSSYREAVLQLSKGKLTTDRSRHSGEGIFFTSLACDKFSIYSGGIFYAREDEEDWFLGSESKVKKGTMVQFTVTKNSPRNLTDIFRKYQTGEDYAFDKTHVLVTLSKNEGETFISRSQAKRVLFGLEKFKHVTLDFKGVDTVGQGFVDEVFRIFKNNHPGIKIDYINANEDVEFMIKRSVANSA